jgi:hypothetical protein
MCYDPESDVSESVLNPYGDGHWMTVMSNIPAKKVWVDPFGYGHVNPDSSLRLETNLLLEEHTTGHMFQIPQSGWGHHLIHWDYLIPLAMPQPIIYSPAVVADPLDGKGGAEPIYETTTVPGKNWENPNPQARRRTTFGRIQV